MSKSENPRFVFFLFIHSKRVAADFSLPRARCLPFPLCCLPRTRGALQCAIAFFFLSTRFATSLTFVFRSFSSASRIKREFSGLSADVDPLSSSTSSPCSSTRAPRHSSGRFLSDDGDSGSTTARELRRGPRGRCPRRGDEEEALRINTDVENRRTQGSFSFLSLSSLQTSHGGLLLAESALFTLLYLLIATDSGALRLAIAFFASLFSFCHLADLRFSFFFLSFSHQAASSPAPA